MKTLGICSLFFASFSIFASNATRDYQTCVHDGTKYVYIPGLRKDLFQTLKIEESKAPPWGDFLTVDKLVDDVDFHEWASYSYELTHSCTSFIGNYWDNIWDNIHEEEPWFSWRSIEEMGGAQKTVFYLAGFNINFFAEDEKVGTVSCTAPLSGDKYVFLNKSDGPVYLGELIDKPCKKPAN